VTLPQAFLSSVLGEGIPASLGEQIFRLVCSSGGRGITLRELLPLLVLLTRGTREEKIKCKKCKASNYLPYIHMYSILRSIGYFYMYFTVH
jgi:hypothetical protein